MRKSIKFLVSLDRSVKTAIVILFDYCLLIAAFWSSLSLRSNEFFVPSTESMYLIFFAPVIAIPIYYLSGLYKSLIRYSNFTSLIVILFAVSIYTILWFLIVLAAEIVVKPYDFLVINWILSILFSGGLRYLARYLFLPSTSENLNALIYGAGSSGIQLHAAMKFNLKLNIVAFIDDDPNLRNNFIEGKKVYSSSEIPKLIKKRNVSEILVALPALKRSKRMEIIKHLNQFPVVIRALPDLSDLAEGKIKVSDLKKINIEDLLKRPKRDPNIDLLKKNIEGKNVLITGGGGSIGSEIARQVCKRNPKSLILFEISEYALYKIDQELSQSVNSFEVINILGDVTDKKQISRVIRDHKIDTIYHTAAYKHVPMIERNIIPAVRCNIFGTGSCLSAALDNNVETFVYISTDKAVRPTNIMGATKRFSEIILQSRINESSKSAQSAMNVSIVRFGNVLGSSGSVVPLFREQLKKGGPITVTHEEVIRYFMTITEASELVIQAGALGNKAEIFILDMGEPVKLIELARDMIQLSGMSVKDQNNPDGDIEIEISGLRPGEKLYEELLIDKSSSPTMHEKIMVSDENFIDWSRTNLLLDQLNSAAEGNDIYTIHSILEETVEGFQHKLDND